MSFSEPSSHELPARPTRIRYVVVAVSTLMSVLLYLDRVCVGFAVDYIREDIRLTQTDVAWFIGAFFWSYALAQVPAGWLSDRYGPRLMLVIYILSWSLFTAMIGAVYSFAFLVIARLGIGLAQAGAYPSCGTLLKRWIPLGTRATASSVVAFGGRVGGALAPLITAALIVWCVPNDAPVKLADGDLLDAPQVFRDLDAADISKPSPVAQVWGLLDEANQKFAWGVVQRLPPKPDQPGKSDPSVEIPSADRERLVGMLNGVIERRDFYDRTAFESIKLNSEATRLLKRDPGKPPLTDYEQERANRLLLEAAFPAGIRKLYVLGWRPVMYFYGAAGLIVASVFWFYFRDSPEQHPGCNEAERRLIAGDAAPTSADPETATPAREPFPAMAILTSRSLWCSSLSQIGTNIGWLFLITWLSRYLLDVHGVPALSRGAMVSIPTMAGMLGLLLGGPLADWLARRLGLLWGRRLPMMATRFIAMSGYAAALLFSTFPSGHPLNSPWAFVAAFSLVAIGTDLGIAATWAFMQDVGGKNVGAILGWGNMWGNLGAAVAAPLYDYILGEQPTLAQWNQMFLFCGAAFIVAGLAAFGIDATKPIVRKP